MFSRIFRFFGCYSISDDHKKTFEEVSSRRHCTNVLWLFIFVAFLTGLLFLGFYAARVGDVSRFIHPTDSFGNRCGMRNKVVKLTYLHDEIHYPMSGMDFRDRPFALPLDVGQADDYAWICVASCPHESIYATRADLAGRLRDGEWNASLCTAVSVMVDGTTVAEIPPADRFTNVGPCAQPPIYASRPVLNRCLPWRMTDLPSAAIAKLKSYLDSEDFLRRLFAEFYAGRYVFLATIVASFVCGCYITYQMIYNNARVVYMLYVATMPCGIVCSVVLLCMFLYNFISSFSLDSAYLGLSTDHERFINGYRVDYVLLLVAFLLVAVFTLVAWTLTWVVFMPRRALVADLFFQTRKPLRCMLWLVVETFCNCLLSLVLFGMWTYTLLNLLSAEEPEWFTIVVRGSADARRKPLISAIWLAQPWWTTFALAYHVFALIWIKSFLSDAQKIFVAQATSTWYFGENRKSQWQFVFFRAIYILICYHLGTVAFGSFVLVLIRIPSHIFLFLYYRIVKSERPRVVHFCSRNFGWMSNLERVLRYIHSNAYAIVAASGEDFLAACKTATNLWMDNSWYLLTANTVAALLFTMTSLTFSLMVAFCAGFYFRLYVDADYWLWPTLVCALLAHFILNRFLALHQMIIETMFLCYASEIDGYESRTVGGLPRKADYGFNYYMTRRIYEDRRLNGPLGFSPSTIGDPSPMVRAEQTAHFIAVYRSGNRPTAAPDSHSDASAGLHGGLVGFNNNQHDQIVQIFRNMTSTPL